MGLQDSPKGGELFNDTAVKNLVDDTTQQPSLFGAMMLDDTNNILGLHDGNAEQDELDMLDKMGTESFISIRMFVQVDQDDENNLKININNLFNRTDHSI